MIERQRGCIMTDAPPLVFWFFCVGLSLLILMNTVIHAEWGRANLDEALGLVGSPARLRLAILAQLGAGQVVGAVDAHGLEAVGAEL